jgi:Ni/Fe-hydrogenase 1 B-type cytochrome subunit
MSHQAKFKRYVWELPVRICHWTTMLAIIILSVTGFLIGTPFSFGSSASDFTIGWIRFIHFVAAYAFTLSLLSRIFWSFVGNRYSSWREFFPFITPEGREKMVKMLRYYMFIDRETPETIGHNPLATTAYVVLFCLYIGIIFTGFALYSLHAPGGFMHRSLGFMFAIFSNQGLRLLHHLGMWLIAGFVINHIYSVWLMDIKEQGSEVSSMFSGFRFTVKDKD